MGVEKDLSKEGNVLQEWKVSAIYKPSYERFNTDREGTLTKTVQLNGTDRWTVEVR